MQGRICQLALRDLEPFAGLLRSELVCLFWHVLHLETMLVVQLSNAAVLSESSPGQLAHLSV